MKKIIKIASLIIMAAMLAGCAQGSGGEENFTKTTVFIFFARAAQRK